MTKCSRINRGCEDVVGDTNKIDEEGPVKTSTPIIDSNRNSWIIDVEYGVPWPIRTSHRIGSDKRDETDANKDGCSGNESKESSTVYDYSKENDTETKTYLYAGDNDCRDDGSSYQESNMCDGVESDGKETDRSYLEIGSCDNCGGRGQVHDFCTTCEDSGMIYC